MLTDFITCHCISLKKSLILKKNEIYREMTGKLRSQKFIKLCRKILSDRQKIESNDLISYQEMYCLLSKAHVDSKCYWCDSRLATKSGHLSMLQYGEILLQLQRFLWFDGTDLFDGCGGFVSLMYIQLCLIFHGVK